MYAHFHSIEYCLNFKLDHVMSLSLYVDDFFLGRLIRFLVLSENEWAFDLLYCVAFVVMDKQWLDKNATYMEFNVRNSPLLSWFVLANFVSTWSKAKAIWAYITKHPNNASILFFPFPCSNCCWLLVKSHVAGCVEIYSSSAGEGISNGWRPTDRRHAFI